MATMTIASPAPGDAGLSYTQNVSRAARALLAALLAVKAAEPASRRAPVHGGSWFSRDDEPQFMMPNLAQELARFAGRAD